jgi:formylglycine-generating enzyme required for sulfatase activity
MGSPETELGHHPAMGTDETIHEVTLTQSFEIMATEVTREMFESVMGFDPSTVVECAPDCPAHDVSWNMAAAFCNALSQLAGLASCYQCTGEGAEAVCQFDDANGTPYDCEGYRLPTEAEWEYAARAGTSTGTYNGDPDVTGCTASTVLDPIAWHCGSTGGMPSGTPHPVAGLLPNDLQLYDMLGNVLEHVHDSLGNLSIGEPLPDATDPWGDEAGLYRLHRGGGWADDAEYSRAAWRGFMSRGEQYPTVGFRPARTLP